MATRTELEHLEKKLAASEVSNDLDFQSVLLNAMNVFCMQDEDLSDLFNVSLLSVNKWKNGIAAPQAALRSMIFKEFTSRLRAALCD